MNKEKYYYVYILASRRYGTLYTGVTGNLEARVMQHRGDTGSVFTKKYGVGILVYYEMFHYVNDAIAREKCIKRWKREWKIRLIEEKNLEWDDLSGGWE